MADRVRRAKAKQQEEQTTQVNFDLLNETKCLYIHFSLLSSLMLNKTYSLCLFDELLAEYVFFYFLFLKYHTK